MLQFARLLVSMSRILYFLIHFHQASLQFLVLYLFGQGRHLLLLQELFVIPSIVTFVVLVDDTFGPVTVNLNTYSPVVSGAVNVAFSL